MNDTSKRTLLYCCWLMYINLSIFFFAFYVKCVYTFGSTDWSLLSNSSLLLFNNNDDTFLFFSLVLCVSRLDSCDQYVMRNGVDDNEKDDDDDETIKHIKYDFFSFLLFCSSSSSCSIYCFYRFVNSEEASSTTYRSKKSLSIALLFYSVLFVWLTKPIVFVCVCVHDQILLHTFLLHT